MYKEIKSGVIVHEQKTDELQDIFFLLPHFFYHLHLPEKDKYC